MKKKRRVKKWPLITLLLLICLVFGALYFFKGYFEQNKEDDNVEVEEKELVYDVSFTLGGNILINAPMWNITRTSDGYNFDSIFEYLNDIMKKSDINFYFEQSIVGGSTLGATSYSDYNTPVELIDTLKNIGFNMNSLASYHAYDRGIDGIRNSIKYLTEKGFTFSGVSDNESNKHNIINKNGVKIGLLSYTLDTDENINEDYEVSIYSDELVKKEIDEIKKEVDVIIVSIDWYNIGNDEVTEEQERIAKYLSDLGVNIVVGDTGYSIQPIVMIDNTLVCYSLGNLLSGHSYIDSRISAMVDFNLNIVKSKEKTEIKFEDINVLLNYTYNLNNNYKVIPFTKMSNELNNYHDYYDKYNELLTTNNSELKLYAIGD